MHKEKRLTEKLPRRQNRDMDKLPMQCLILGGAGFIGANISRSLVEQGYAVRIFDRPNVDLHNIADISDRVEFIGGDFTNAKDLAVALENADIVLHLVGTTLPATSVANPVYDIETNVIGTIKLLELCRKQKIQRIIFPSSGGTVYGRPQTLPIPETHATDPICSYGISKLAIEKYLRLFNELYGLEYTILRIANPYGQHQNQLGQLGAVNVFLWKAITGQTIVIWGDGTIARDYFHIDDLVSAFLKVIKEPPISRIYNIGSGKPQTLNEIISAISRITGIEPKVEYAAGRIFDIPVNYLDIRRAEQELGWRPKVSISEGIRHTWEWMKTVK